MKKLWEIVKKTAGIIMCVIFTFCAIAFVVWAVGLMVKLSFWVTEAVKNSL